MRLYNQATVECSNLWAALESQASAAENEDPASDMRMYIFDTLVPFDLLVFRARTSYFVKDAYDYLDQLVALRDTCLLRHKRASKIGTDVQQADIWKERCSRIGLLIASQLLEMQVHRVTQYAYIALFLTRSLLPHSNTGFQRRSEDPT